MNLRLRVMQRRRVMMRRPLTRPLRAIPRLPMPRMAALMFHQLPLVIRLQNQALTQPQLPRANPPRIQRFRRRLIQRRILKSQTSNSARVLRCARFALMRMHAYATNEYSRIDA